MPRRSTRHRNALATINADSTTLDGEPTAPKRSNHPPPIVPPLERVKTLVAAHAPVFALHPNDAYRPCSGTWFAQRSTLLMHGKPVLPRDVPTTLHAVLQQQARLGGAANTRAALRLHLDPAARSGVPLDELPSVPLYVRAQMVVPVDGGRRTCLEITYIVCYAHNGAYKLATVGPGCGRHDGDWERITARIDAESGEVVAYWFNAHRPRDGEWVAAAALPRDAHTGRPLAFVARHGHGHYPRAGTIPRGFGLINDRTRADGPRWWPTTCVMFRVWSRDAPAPTLGRVACRGCEVDDRATGCPPRGVAPKSVRWWSGDVAARQGRDADVHIGGDGVAHPGGDGGARKSDADTRAHNHIVAVVDDVEGVGDFAGTWGKILAPRSQGWWEKSECPVSRGPMLRLFGEAWPEPK